jgi:hypothetical protein
MIFSEPQAGTVPNTTPPINYQRIAISTLNSDGTTGDLIMPTETVFSFGVSENINPETKKVNGHVLPLCLWNRDGASAAEKEWSDTFNSIVERCKEHLVDNREELGGSYYDLTKNDLKKFNPLYWKRDKNNPDKKLRGKIVKGTGPTLYAKLISSKKQGKILSMFFDFDGESLDPLILLGKYCTVKAAVKIESIFIGNKISLQIKLYEAEVKPLQSGMTPLMARPKSKKRVLTGNSMNMNEMKEALPESDNDGSGSDVGSVASDSEEEEVVKPKPKPKRRVRRAKKRVSTE